MDEIAMKQNVKDTVSGFSGTVTGIAKYLDGTTTCLIQSKMADPSKYPESTWIDSQRLEITE